MDQPLHAGTPKWLKRLQENSWEAEILISGGAIVSLFIASDAFIEFAVRIKFMTNFAGMDGFINILMLSLKGITIGFILHLILRGMWISLVCLNYAFPNGINFNRLKLAQRYEKMARGFDLPNQIVALDKASGLVFFASFVFALILLGYFTSIAIGVYVIYGLFATVTGMSLGSHDINRILVLSIFLGIFFIDFITGWFRKGRIGKLYWPFYLVFNTITLAFIYRPWLQILFSNVNRWKAFAFSLILLVLAVAYTNISLQRVFHWRSFMDTRQYDYAPEDNGTLLTSFYNTYLEKSDVVFAACIPSEVIAGNYLKVFVPYRSRYDKEIEAVKGNYFSDIVSIAIDDSLYQHVEWFPARHEITEQTGILAMLDIKGLAKKKHVLSVEIRDETLKKLLRATDGAVKIPFWME